jgi:hypothetical protein
MINEIVAFGGLNWFFLIILNEIILRCVIKFGRFVRIFKTIGNGRKKRIIISTFNICENLNFFQANGIIRFGGLNLLF